MPRKRTPLLGSAFNDMMRRRIGIMQIRDNNVANLANQISIFLDENRVLQAFAMASPLYNLLPHFHPVWTFNSYGRVLPESPVKEHISDALLGLARVVDGEALTAGASVTFFNIMEKHFKEITEGGVSPFPPDIFFYFSLAPDEVSDSSPMEVLRENAADLTEKAQHWNDRLWAEQRKMEKIMAPFLPSSPDRTW